MVDVEQAIKVLLDQAKVAKDSADALRFTQAALNTAHIKHALAESK